jgi:antitoxin ParD1/3/4
MHVSLTSNLEEMVRAKVESGAYNNASEVIREALRLMVERDRLREARLAHLRQALAEGEASGPAAPFDFDALQAELDAEADAA